VKRRTNHINPPRDGSEKDEAFLGRARPAKYGALQKTSSLELAGKTAQQERHRLFRARHVAGERAASNSIKNAKFQSKKPD
jgi:hypothetical protein